MRRKLICTTSMYIWSRISAGRRKREHVGSVGTGFEDGLRGDNAPSMDWDEGDDGWSFCNVTVPIRTSNGMATLWVVVGNIFACG